MKLTIEQSDSFREPEITIRCGMIDAGLQHVINELQLMMFSISGSKDGAIHKLALEDIFYFESVDEKTFVCCEREVYQCGYRLYELEERLEGTDFVRISKSVILNTAKLKSIRPQLNGRFEAVMENGEKQIINRHYVEALRSKFEGGA